MVTAGSISSIRGDSYIFKIKIFQTFASRLINIVGLSIWKDVLSLCFWNISGLVSDGQFLTSAYQYLITSNKLKFYHHQFLSLQLPSKSRWQAEKFYLGWDKPRDELQRFKTFNLNIRTSSKNTIFGPCELHVKFVPAIHVCMNLYII